MSLDRFGVANEPVIADQVHAKNFSGRIVGFETAPLDKAKRLLSLAEGFSNAPISGFHVGAVAIGESGKLYLGANLEFTGVPLSSSLHAEQSAVLNARAHGETAISGIVVSAAPCGHCRQFLWELPNAGALKVVFEDRESTLEALLPNAFGEPRAPGHSLLDTQQIDLQPMVPQKNVLAQRAIEVARNSYVPYTQSPEGLALACVDGTIFTGCTSESVAFNPTVPALIAALNQRNFSHSRNDSITRIVYARLATSLIGQKAFVEALMRRVTNAKVEKITLEQV